MILFHFYNYTNSESGNVFSKRTEFVGGQQLYSERKSTSESETKSNKANFSFIDRSSDLRTITLRGRINSSNTTGNSLSTLDAFAPDSKTVKEVLNTGVSNSDNNSSNGSVNLDYIQRFNKKSKRSFELEFDFSSDKSDNTSGNTNTKDYADILKTDEKTENKQTSNNKGSNINFELQYTEPLNDNHFIEVGGGMRVQNEDEYTNQTSLLHGTTNAGSTTNFNKKKDI